MISTLYKCFQHWSEKGSVYIISDTHFGETDMNWRWSLINDFPFVVLDSLADDNEIAQRIAEYLVWKINNTVHKNDTLIVLGDVGDIGYIKQLKAGYKVLIQGNHDSGVSNYLKCGCGFPHCMDTDCTKCKYFKGKLFDEVYDGSLTISDSIILSHVPIDGYWLNIHGHVHSDALLHINPPEDIGFNLYNSFSGADKKFINCSCEWVNFTPINLKDIINSGRLKNIETITRTTINAATERKRHKDDNGRND